MFHITVNNRCYILPSPDDMIVTYVNRSAPLTIEADVIIPKNCSECVTTTTNPSALVAVDNKKWVIIVAVAVILVVVAGGAILAAIVWCSREDDDDDKDDLYRPKQPLIFEGELCDSELTRPREITIIPDAAYCENHGYSGDAASTYHRRTTRSAPPYLEVT